MTTTVTTTATATDAGWRVTTVTTTTLYQANWADDDRCEWYRMMMHPDTVTTTDGIAITITREGPSAYTVAISNAAHRFESAHTTTYLAAKHEQLQWLSGRFGWPPKFTDRDRVV